MMSERKYRIRRYLPLFLLLFGIGVAGYGQAPKREMRGTWIATVANIDWPLKAGMNTEAQKQEMIVILDNVVKNNMNCIAFQIRPTADAFYRSKHEPWSHWLTGTQGVAPAYDPLQFVIDECDKRGITVHVWINPYRVWLDEANLSPELKQSFYQRYAGWMTQYGKSHYLHPADGRARQYITEIVADIVENYDIDAIHMDDYFYPYRIAGVDFPDETYFRKDPRGFRNKDDWRRDNVDRIIRQVSDTIRAIKPWVEFGISPFGVWRNASRDPRGSATRAGQTNYDDLYADILKWEREGWIDYVSPQLYWHIGFAVADYKVLVKWWNDNANGTPTYIGHALYRVDARSSTAEWRTWQEIVRQIELNRTYPNIQGSFLYSAKFLAQEGLQQALLTQVYQHKSIWPENPRVEPVEPMPPGFPYLFYDGRNIRLGWQPELDNRRFVIYRFGESETPDFSDPAHIVCITGSRNITLPAGAADTRLRYFVSALSLTHHESEPVKFYSGRTAGQ